MKRHFYLILAVISMLTLLTGCGFFSTTSSSRIDSESSSADDREEVETDDQVPDDAQDVPVSDPSGSSEEEHTDETPAVSDTSAENPQENVAADANRSYTTTGIFCGFADNHSVEIELADGSFWTFFTFDEGVTQTLSALNEEAMPEITFVYKAREGQINPEIVKIVNE